MSGSHTIKNVRDWVQAMGDKGLYNSETARFRITALERLASVLGDDESQDPELMLNNLAQLAKRWATKNSGSPGTMKTYESRARGALEDFLAYQEDPSAFKGRRREDATEGKPIQRTKGTSVAAVDDPPAKTTSTARSEPGFTSRFPLGDGQSFAYSLPVRGLTTKDVRKIAFHLLSFAEDFDPASSSSLFAIQKSDS